MANRTRVLITVLVLVIVVLAGILLFTFFLRPQVTGYTTQKQIEGYQIAINDILRQLQQQGFVQIPLGEGQVLTLVPYIPPQQAPQQVPEPLPEA